MEAYEIDQGWCASNVTLQLTGRAQQDYSTLDSHKATQYAEVKKVILK